MKSKYLVILGLLVVALLHTSSGLTTEHYPTINEPEAQHLDPVIERSSHHHHNIVVKPKLKGFWKKNFVWRPRWVKTWQEKKVYVAIWKRMWGPVEVKEWVPVPQPPPGWTKPSLGPLLVKKIPH